MSSSVGVGPSSTPGPSSAAGAAASTSTQQGPMGASSTRGGTATATGMGTGTDLWSDILQSAGRQKGYGKKNVLLLSERSRGRTHLLTLLTSGGTARRRQNKRNPGTGLAEGKDGRGTLALGYEVMEVREEGDEVDSVWDYVLGNGMARYVLFLEREWEGMRDGEGFTD
ncbi:LOW QUALITY PROTEIN: hypothetical protein JCM24511_02254 [Saitozyma sp. JCM 24511]|nr:LOW QUALITY PROTEIN: hypothetical protein JCM24511_02254 [Saitozyma sp. JCM 24511]